MRILRTSYFLDEIKRTKKMRDVRISRCHKVSRRDLCNGTYHKGLRFGNVQYPDTTTTLTLQTTSSKQSANTAPRHQKNKNQ